MKCEFTELEFMLNVIIEMNNKEKYGVKNGNLYFPSQYNEKKLGYDVEVYNLPIFFQFKRADRIKRNNQNNPCRAMKCPYYRFKLYKCNISNQHNLLVDLANRGNNQVYYVAPMFCTFAEMRNYSCGGTILDNTLFLKTNRLSKITGATQHHICYSHKYDAKMFSEECIIDGGDMLLYEELINSLNSKMDSHKVEKVKLEKLLSNIRDQIHESDKNSSASDMSVLKYLANHGIILAVLC